MRLMRKHPRGVALVLVVTVLAITAVLGVAMLSASAVQARASQSGVLASQAQGLAESGVQLALYYLQYPTRAPSVNRYGYWGGENNISLDSAATGVPGTVNVTVSRVARGLYDIVSTGTRLGVNGQAIQRTITVEVQVSTGSQTGYAVAFANDTTVPDKATINGNVQANKKLTAQGKIHGTVYYGTSAAASGSGLIDNSAVLTDDNRWPLPTAANLRDYHTYWYKGKLYNADPILVSVLPSNTTLGPTSTNPAGIYYRAGGLTTGAYFTVNGTLLIDGGPLNINGNYNSITAQNGFPALVCRGDLIVKSTGPVRDLTVNGVTWMSGNIKSSGTVTGSMLRFHGSLMFASGNIDGAYAAALVATYDPNAPMAPDMDLSLPQMGSKVMWWRQ